MLYPLKFEPILKERLWGGSRLVDSFGKKAPAESKLRYGESWELSGVQSNLSIVTNGFLAGNNLEELIQVYMGDLVGERIFQKFGDEFPLLIKLIDTSDYLSVQVHPDNEMAAKLHHAYGKSEMWYVLDSEPESWIITGFSRKITKEEYFEIIRKKNLSEYLRYEKVSKDDYFYIPARRIHAIGRGVMLVEIQQTSDITYRIYDWDRVDENGKSRELHTDLAIEAIDFSVFPCSRRSNEIERNKSQELVKCPFFTTNRLVIDSKIERDFYRLDSFMVYLCLDGEIEIMSNNNDNVKLIKGELVLIPAALNSIAIMPKKEAKLLEVYC